MSRKLKNYTTKVPANRSVAEIQGQLAAHGASGVLLEYAKDGTGRIESLSFKIAVNGKDVGFRLPLKWKEAQAVMSRGRRYNVDDDLAYRVAWRIVRDWVDVQMAILDLEIVQLQEIFLPYAIGKDGRTVYETFASDPSRLLGGGQ